MLAKVNGINRSPLMRGRGLKLTNRRDTLKPLKFAPHAGAWIETNFIMIVYT